MKWGWRWRPAVVAVVVSILLTGCGAEFHSSQSSGCFEASTTTPDWMFDLLLGSGGVAWLSGLVWVLFVPGLIKAVPQPQPQPKQWWSSGGRAHLAFVAALLVLAVTNLIYTAFNSRAQTSERYLIAALLGVGALTVGGVIVVARRYRATRVWPSGRQAPWGLFWVLPVIFLAAAGSATWALTMMVMSMERTTQFC